MGETALVVADRKAIERRADVRMLVDDWHARLDVDVRAGEIADATRVTYQIGVRKFLTWANRRKVITDDAVREWVADERSNGRAPSTVNTWLAGVRHFFTWAAGARRLSAQCVARERGGAIGENLPFYGMGGLFVDCLQPSIELALSRGFK